MIRKLTMGVCILFVASGLYAANKEQERLENSGVVMEEIMNTPENIPQEILEKAECVIVFPSVLKAGVRSRRKLRPRRNGLPHRCRIRRTLGRSSHVRPGRRQLWFSARWTSDGPCSAGHE